MERDGVKDKLLAHCKQKPLAYVTMPRSVRITGPAMLRLA